jgi:hypothetical protein
LTCVHDKTGTACSLIQRGGKTWGAGGNGIDVRFWRPVKRGAVSYSGIAMVLKIRKRFLWGESDRAGKMFFTVIAG